MVAKVFSKLPFCIILFGFFENTFVKKRGALPPLNTSRHDKKEAKRRAVIPRASACFTDIVSCRSFRKTPPKRDVALILENKLPFPDMGVRDPLLTETPQRVLASLWYFAGAPNSGTPPPLRRSTRSPSRRRKLRRSSVARLLLSPFRIYIRRGPLEACRLPKCGTDF